MKSSDLEHITDVIKDAFFSLPPLDETPKIRPMSYEELAACEPLRCPVTQEDLDPPLRQAGHDFDLRLS